MASKIIRVLTQNSEIIIGNDLLMLNAIGWFPDVLKYRGLRFQLVYCLYIIRYCLLSYVVLLVDYGAVFIRIFSYSKRLDHTQFLLL